MFGGNECLAMLLAGGRGERLGTLTKFYPKPAISFGGGYRIIDFTLNNCVRSGIGTMGVLSQYLAGQLHKYVDSLVFDNNDAMDISMLPPAVSDYVGTADAVYQNIRFIDRYAPENVLILSSDHVYDMDYREMLSHHIRTNASATIAATPVDWKETSRFGIITSDSTTRITQFEEKPAQARSNLASMGIYIFKWSVLRRRLLLDKISLNSSHDFGKDLIPAMLRSGERLYTYPFDGYWRDVGTVESLWQANMDLLNQEFKISPERWTIRSASGAKKPVFISHSAKVSDSIVSSGGKILGNVRSSIVSDSVIIEEGAEVSRCVVMPNVYIGRGAKIDRAVIDSGSFLMDNTTIRPALSDSPAAAQEGGVCLVSPNTTYYEASYEMPSPLGNVSSR